MRATIRMAGFSAAALVMALGGCERSSPPQPTVSSSSPETPFAANSTSASPSQPSTPVAAGRFAPRDDCARVEGTGPFRAALAEAIRRRDAAGVVALADPAVKLGFGGQDGAANLRQQLAAPDGKLFAELAKLQTLGCAIDARGAMVTPWYFAQDLGVDDPYMAMLVTANDVPLRSGADPTAAPKATVSWDVVTLVGSYQPERPFQQVKTRDRKIGYVATGALRSLLAYRLLAEKRDGEWKITALLAGD